MGKRCNISIWTGPGGAMISCQKCGGRLSFSGENAKEKVIKAWNNRVYPKEVQEAIRIAKTASLPIVED